MTNLFSKRERNALILGLVLGVPQGLMMGAYNQFAGTGFDDINLMLLFCFGLFVPPILFLCSRFIKVQQTSAHWETILKHVNPAFMVSWGALSIGVAGAFSLHHTGASQGYAACAFFIGAAVGFATVFLLEHRLIKNIDLT